jgi:hypothetical protein
MSWANISITLEKIELLMLRALLLSPLAIYLAVFLAAACDYVLAGGPSATVTESNPPVRVPGLTSPANHS